MYISFHIALKSVQNPPHLFAMVLLCCVDLCIQKPHKDYNCILTITSQVSFRSTKEKDQATFRLTGDRIPVLLTVLVLITSCGLGCQCLFPGLERPIIDNSCSQPVLSKLLSSVCK